MAKTIKPKDGRLGGGEESAFSHLPKDDAALWTRVARTTEPLKGKRPDASLLHDEMAALMRASSRAMPAGTKKRPTSATPFVSEPKPSLVPPVHHPIEDRVHKHLAKGRLSIDGRLDLHGMTQNQAQDRLLRFLDDSQRSGCRVVLVITGKGERGTGILRRMVPSWFDLHAFRRLVNGYRAAHVSHGGDGALYVRLRKSRGEQMGRKR
ncbi:MAG: Smr/MutS family protein [Pseudomonadota bacterium]